MTLKFVRLGFNALTRCITSLSIVHTLNINNTMLHKIMAVLKRTPLNMAGARGCASVKLRHGFLKG